MDENIEDRLSKIRNPKTYDPTKISNEVLADDWRIVNSWFAILRDKNKDIKYSEEEIISLARKIYREILRRVKAGKMKHEFKPEKMKPTSKELFEIVRKTDTMGIYLKEPHADWIRLGLKNLIVQTEDFSDLLNKPLTLLGPRAYGTITLTSMEKISLSAFKSLRDKHRISETERQDWGSKDSRWLKGPFYAYKFKFKPFPREKEYEKPKKLKTFIKNVIIKSERTHENCMNFLPDPNNPDFGFCRLHKKRVPASGDACPSFIPKITKTETPFIKFYGTRGMVKEKSPEHLYHSSLLLDSGKTRVLIDWGEIHPENIPERLDAVIITHAHPDHFFGLKGREVPNLFITDATLESPYFKKEDFDLSRVHIFKRRSSFSIGDISFVSVPVLHSSLAPNIALFITMNGKRICYASDILNMMSNHRDRFLQDCDLYIGDLSTLEPHSITRWSSKYKEPIGHASPKLQMKWASSHSVKQIIFTHLGSASISNPELLEERILSFSKELGLSRPIIATDNLEINLSSLTKTRPNHQFPDLERIDENYVKNLSDKTLIALDKFLHEKYKELGKISEPLLNAHIETWKEMDLRNLPHKIEDPLTQETRFWIIEYPAPKSLLTLEEVIEAFPDKLSLPVSNLSIYLVGGTVNRGWTIFNHDIDVLISNSRRIPEVEREIISKIKRNDVREKISFIWDETGGIGWSILLYDGNGIKKSGLQLFRPIQPTKPGKQFFSTEKLYKEWVASRLNPGIMIQPKADGMSFMIHISPNRIAAYTEDKKRDRIQAFKKSEEDFSRIKARNGIFVAEMVEYSNKILSENETKIFKKFEQKPREELVKWITEKPETLDDSRVVFNFHDILFLNDKPVYDLPYRKRYYLLKKVVPETKHMHVIDSWEVSSKAGFEDALDKARSYPNSEGAVLKSFNFKYKISPSQVQRSNEVAKIKNLKDINVMVFDPHPVSGSPGNFNYTAYIGPLTPKQLKEGWRKEDLRKWKGKTYLRIGTTYNVKAKLPAGAILEVHPIRIREYEINGVRSITWMFPRVGSPRPDKHEPDDLAYVRRLVKLGTAPLQKSSIFISLQPCPYWDNSEICPLYDKIKIVTEENGKRVIKAKEIYVEELKYPVKVCPLASHYKCQRIKDYYYTFRRVK